MRAKFMSETESRATLEFVDEHGDRHIQRYRAPSDGGYVYCTDERGNTSQPCDGLAPLGNTLLWNARKGPLVDLIRREWARNRRQERE